MNKLTGLTFVFLLGVVSFSFGQEAETKNYISKGQWMAGGRIGRLSLTTSDNHSSSISPIAGYFVGKKVAVGINPEYSYSVINLSGPVSETHRTLGTSLFVRDYFSTGRVAPFVEFMGGARWTKQENYNLDYYNWSTSKNSYGFFDVGLGLNYFISRDVALEGILRYTDDNGYSGNLLDFDIGLQFFPSRNNKSASDENGNYFSKGQWIIGGTGNVSLDAVDDIGASSFSISPMAGYLVRNKIAVGLSTGFVHTNGPSNSFIAAPFLRYYLTQKKLAPYAEVAYGGSWTKIEYLNNKTEEFTSSLYRVGAGLNYFVSKNVALDGNLFYSHNHYRDSGSTKFSIGLQFFIR